jgi:hypothetical protein
VGISSTSCCFCLSSTCAIDTKGIDED